MCSLLSYRSGPALAMSPFLYLGNLPNSGTSRLVQPRDLWTHPRKDETKTHPYYVNYIGTKNLIEAAEKAGVKRLVRITGLTCGLSAFNPFAYLLNLAASMTIK